MNDTKLASIEQAFNLALKKIKDNETDRINLQFECVKDDIHLKIESFKNELDNVKDNYDNELDGLKKDVMSVINGWTDIKRQDLGGLDNEIATDVKKTNETGLAEKSPILLSENDLFKNLKQKLGSSKYEKIDLNATMMDLCLLPNGNLMCAFKEPNCIRIYDQNFMVLRTITKIEDEDIPSCCLITTDNISRIYIKGEHSILMTDFDFKKMKKIGSYGKNMQQFSYISDFCYYENHLYVCDTYNKRIQKFTSELDLADCFQLDFEPSQIEIYNGNACICSRGYLCSLNFFTFEPFELQSEEEELFEGRITRINSVYYKYEPDDCSFACYNEYGCSLGYIHNKAFKELINNGVCASGKIIKWNDDVYVVSEFGRTITRFIIDDKCNNVNNNINMNMSEMNTNEPSMLGAYLVLFLIFLSGLATGLLIYHFC